MFHLSESAIEIIANIVQKERKSSEEKLYVRVSMGTC